MKARPPAIVAALCALAVAAGCGVPAQTAPVATTKSWPAPKPTKVYTVEELATTIGCTPNFQGTTTDFRQAMCKSDKDKYLILDFVTDKGQKAWFENAILYGGSYLVGDRWIISSTSEKQMIKLQNELGGRIEQDESMGANGHGMDMGTDK